MILKLFAYLVAAIFICLLTCTFVGSSRRNLHLMLCGMVCLPVVKMGLPSVANWQLRLIPVFLLLNIMIRRGFSANGLMFLVLIPAVVFVFTAMFHGQFPGGSYIVRVDVINIITMTLIGFCLGVDRMSKLEFERFHLTLHRVMMACGLGLAGLGLFKLMLLTRGVQLSFCFNERFEYPQGSALSTDYNLYALSLSLCLGSLWWLRGRETNRLVKMAISIGLPVITAAILLTGSRRGLSYLLMGTAIVLAVAIHARWRGQRPQRTAYQTSNGRLIVAGLWVGLAMLFFFGYSGISNLLSEVLYSYESQSRISRLSTLFLEQAFGTRSVYWDLCWNMLQQFEIYELVLGSGFDYLGECGRLGDIGEDTPHNFLISAILYGGFLQAMLILALVLGVSWRIKWLGGEFRVWGWWYLLLIIFHSTSSNSYFSTDFLFLLSLAIVGIPIRKQAIVDGVGQVERFDIRLVNKEFVKS